MYVYVDTGQFLYLDISVRQQQVDDDVNRKALHVVQTLLDSVQLGSQLHAGVKFSSFPDLVQNGFMEILAAERQTMVLRVEKYIKINSLVNKIV